MAKDAIIRKTGRAKSHQTYRTSDGEKQPGGSTLSRVVNYGSPDGLMSWAVKLNEEGTDFREYRKEAAAFGDAFHRVVECWVKQEVFDAENYVGAYVAPAQRMADSFFKKLDSLGLYVLKSETQGVSELLRAGGTIDLVLARKGSDEPVGLGDLKSSNSVGTEAIIQVAGVYSYVFEELFGKRPEIIRLFRVDRNPPHPCFAHRVEEDQIHAARLVAKLAREAWTWKPCLTRKMITE